MTATDTEEASNEQRGEAIDLHQERERAIEKSEARRGRAAEPAASGSAD
jgi:hypothetical protein